MESLNLSRVAIREKLVVECPDLIKQAGLTQVDFGSVFLNAEGEGKLIQAENIANNAIDGLNGVHQYISKDAIDSVTNTIQFIIKDLVETLTSYVRQKFETYVSPDFPISLGKEFIQTTARYTKEYTKTPAQIFEEVSKDPVKKQQDEMKEKERKDQSELINKIKETSIKTSNKIQEIMDTIQPYTEEVSKYLIYGPDYIMNELVTLYKRYLDKGIGYVDEQIAMVETYIHTKVDEWALTSGIFAAEQLNITQRKIASDVINKNKYLIDAAKVKAMSLVNKATMNLLSIIGG